MMSIQTRFTEKVEEGGATLNGSGVAIQGVASLVRYIWFNQEYDPILCHTS